jgi:hypothetical protein
MNDVDAERALMYREIAAFFTELTAFVVRLRPLLDEALNESRAREKARGRGPR